MTTLIGIKNNNFAASLGCSFCFKSEPRRRKSENAAGSFFFPSKMKTDFYAATEFRDVPVAEVVSRQNFKSTNQPPLSQEATMLTVMPGLCCLFKDPVFGVT